MVHPVPLPESIRKDITRKDKDGIRNQYLIILTRGKDRSTNLAIRGINQLASPPIMKGITIKKIIRRAWAVRTQLYK